MGRPQPGVLLLSKPVGETSFSQVQQVRAALEAEPGKRHSVCHAGALDPFASGLLPVLIGSATRLFERVHELPKTYLATVRWGLETDTGDLHGAETLRGPTDQLAPATLDAALTPFLGWHDQVPPATSNKRVDGERAWKRAHRGEAVELPPQRVFLLGASFVEHSLPHQSVLRLTARGGFYVRSLARDLGRALGCGAHLVALERTEIGPWRAALAPSHLAGAEALSWWPTVSLGDDEWGRLRHDGSTPARAAVRPATWRWPEGFPPPTALTVALHQGRVVALLEGTPASFRQHTSLLPPL